MNSINSIEIKLNLSQIYIKFTIIMMPRVPCHGAVGAVGLI